MGLKLLNNSTTISFTEKILVGKDQNFLLKGFMKNIQKIPKPFTSPVGMVEEFLI